MKEKYRNTLIKIPGGNFVLKVTRNLKDRIRRMLIPTTIFESMGFTYLGPVDGHDTEELISLLKIARDMHRPVLLHVMTQKGRGYAPAQEHPKLFHGVGKFNPVTGEVAAKKGPSFSDSFGSTMCQLAAAEPRVCTITAAMPGGTGLLDFKKQFPKRMFDVGIAEEHAMSMAGGLAKQGMIPVVALYSTFLQRAYDMILQDVCMLNLHVVLAVDRAGLVGEDGETHHGIYDVGFLRQMPNMTLLCPASMAEQQAMLRWAVTEHTGPVAVRYPRGGDGEYTDNAWDPVKPVIVHGSGSDCAIITYGTVTNNALAACEILKQNGICASVVRLARVEPMPLDELASVLAGYKHAVVVEEISRGSGIYEEVACELHGRVSCVISHIDLGHQFVTQGSMDALYKHYGLDGTSIARHIQEVLTVEN